MINDGYDPATCVWISSRGTNAGVGTMRACSIAELYVCVYIYMDDLYAGERPSRACATHNFLFPTVRDRLPGTRVYVRLRKIRVQKLNSRTRGR